MAQCCMATVNSSMTAQLVFKHLAVTGVTICVYQIRPVRSTPFLSALIVSVLQQIVSNAISCLGVTGVTPKEDVSHVSYFSVCFLIELLKNIS